MTQQRARRVAWAAWVVGVAGIAAGAALEIQFPYYSVLEEPDPIANTVWSASWVGFGLVGALIVGRRPDNRVGWALCGITFFMGVNMFVAPYGRAAMLTNGALPLGDPASWLAAWTFAPGLGMVIAVLLLFPNGRLLARRRHGLWAALIAAVALNTLVAMVSPGPVAGDAPPDNPLGIEAWGGPLAAATETISKFIGLIALLVLIDLVYRFWRSRGAERQQFKWLALAACAFPILMAIAITAESSITGQRNFDPVVLVFFACGNGIAAAIGVAVSRHGLYEIDRVVSRSVGYLVLTALLVGVYLVAVTVLTTLTAPITGESPIAVAAATLLAAAAFGPVRRRTQGIVDRRFNRARYDAARTVDTYRGRLRDEVDLEALTSDFLATVGSSMQPAGAALWLRPAGAAQEFSSTSIAVTVPERLHETKGTS